jgi:hypothetical protein
MGESKTRGVLGSRDLIVAGEVKDRTHKTTGCGNRFSGREFVPILAEGAGDAFGEFDLIFGAGLFGVLFEG